MSGMLMANETIYLLAFIIQVFIYALALAKMLFNIDNKVLNMVYYYCMTVFAQIVGVKNIITGKAKPFWEKAESTR